ncbi:MAG TPA: beta-lactamase family protein [Clostridiales bacterium]|nr:beta-lactamase family protein [Clostridiales bacterium]
MKEIKLMKERGSGQCRHFHGNSYGTGAMPIMAGMDIIMDIDKILNSKENFRGVTMFERMEKWNIPGVSFTIIRNGDIAASYTYGRKKRYDKEPVTVQTMFQAASVSKPIFATAVMRLAEQKILDIDTNINQYLKGYHVPTFDGKEYAITLRRILSHTAGLNIHGFPGYHHEQKIPTLMQILEGKRPANTDELFVFKEPGKEFCYSGGGYVLAQKVVCDILNKDFEEIMQETVLQPFGMKDSTYLQPLPKDKEANIAYGIDSHGLQIKKGYCIMPELSAAGLWTTPNDLAAYGIEMMKALKGDSKLVKKETAQAMINPVTPACGLGLFLGEQDGVKYFGHRGWNTGFNSGMSFFPQNGDGIAVMVNSDRGDPFVTMLMEAIIKSFDYC